MELQHTRLALRSALSRLNTPSRQSSRFHLHQQSPSLPIRSITSSTPHRAQAAAAREEDSTDQPQSQSPQTPPKRNLFSRTSPSQFQRPRTPNRDSALTNRSRPNRDRSVDASSIDDILDAALLSNANATTRTPRPAKPQSPTHAFEKSALEGIRMRGNSGTGAGASARAPRTQNASLGMRFDSAFLTPSARVEQDIAPAPFRMSAALGRSVQLGTKHGWDLARALTDLGSRLGSNSVRRDFARQQFHERPGMKRKRLASERFRARFKMDFRATISRVQELTRKGW